MRLAVLALLLTACGMMPTDERITYATVQTLNPGVDGAWILQEHPEARNVVRAANGRVQRLEYRVTDPQGRGQTLVLHFDEFGILERKEYSGRLLKPLDADPEAQRGITGKPRDR
jgi:hypothetical protein